MGMDERNFLLIDFILNVNLSSFSKYFNESSLVLLNTLIKTPVYFYLA